jgi:hypothetical protein
MPKPAVQVKFTRTWVGELFGRVDPTMRVAAEAVKEYQKAHIPVSADGSHGRPAGYARDRIQIRVRVTSGFLTAGRVYEIGSDATSPDGFPYPVVLDVGAPPHVIESHGNYPLRDPETKQVFGHRVMHPGVTGNNWCRGSIVAARVVL